MFTILCMNVCMSESNDDKRFGVFIVCTSSLCHFTRLSDEKKMWKVFFWCVFTYVGGYIKEWGIDLQSEENPLLTQRRVGWIGYKYMQYIPASVVDSMLIKLNVGSPSFSSSLNFFELNSRLYKFLVGFSFSICFKTSTFPVVVIDAILSTCGEEVNSKRV